MMRNQDGFSREIAKIEGTHLGPEDHGIFTAWVHVTYGGAGQGLGGYAFDQWDEEKNQRVGGAFGMDWIMRFMEAAGVQRWEDLPGRTIYVLHEDDSLMSPVVGVENLPTEPGKQFLFADLVQKHKAALSA